jgi:Putative peptidoglycan binding domain
MGDGSAIGGWILAAAIVTVLAGGANAAGGSGGSGASASSGRSGSSARSSTSATRTTGTTGNGTTRPAAACTRVSTVRSMDGKRYHTFPVSTDGSYLCGLEPGDSGRPVTVLQQALALCSDRAVTVDGTYSADTRGAVRRDQRRQLGPTPDGVYGPETARGVRWPWFDRSTGKFTGHCALAGERSG